MTAGPAWDPDVYLRHADDRSRPFVDLLARVPGQPRSIVDLGCGPGHLTDVLLARWPDAAVLGVDSSPEMVEAARARGDGASYVQADVSTWAPPHEVDLIISNALFQWVPDRDRVVRRLADAVAPGGVFALQVPDNADAPSHRLLRELAAREPYAQHTASAQHVPPGPPEQYLELFADLGWTVDAWSTTYLHVLPGDDPVWSWVSGTGRPCRTTCATASSPSTKRRCAMRTRRGRTARSCRSDAPSSSPSGSLVPRSPVGLPAGPA